MTYTVETTYSGLETPALAARLPQLTARLPDALTQVKGWRENGTLPYLDLPFQTRDLDALATVARRFQSLETVVVLGTGGSSLGAKTLYALADQGFGNRAGGPRMHFLDNVDPATFTALLTQVNLATMGLLVVSKSGTTAETLCQFLTLLPELEKANPGGWQRQTLVITEPGGNSLRALAGRYGLETFEHDPKVGGRFSVLSLVGLLPAMIAGLDAHAIRRGAKNVLEPVLSGDTSHAAAQGAVWNVAWAQEGRTQTVLMPYIDQLAEFGMWFRQLWAESLGKNGLGTTPIRAMGTVDQHSQMQLYMDGPKDKIFTVLVKNARGEGAALNTKPFEDIRLDYLHGRSMGDLLDAEQQAAIVTMARRGCPVRVIRVPALHEESLGALLMHYMLETILSAALMGVNAFDQPAVEEGKILTREYLGNAA